MTTKNDMLIMLDNRKNRSAWSKAVTLYAYELIEQVEEEVLPDDFDELEEILLNGARNWLQYSEGGCSLCYDYQIAERLCTKKEFERYIKTQKNPNKYETWLQCQARALYQASALIRNLMF